MIKENNIVLFTDTDCDVTKEIADKYGYHLISMPYVLDGKEIKPEVDYEKFDAHTYYQKLREGSMPKTGALNPNDYIEYFEPIFKEDKDILYVHFSTAMSGTFNSMNIAYQTLLDDYPDRKLYEIDTKGVSINSLPLVLEISDLYHNGASIEELLEYGKKEVDHWATFFFADDLTFFKRSGRVKSLAAFMGNIIGIKPILYFDDDGLMNPKSKVRGSIAAINAVLESVEQLQQDFKEHRIFIANTDNLKQAKMLEERLKERFGKDIEVEIVDVNPTIGAHCGPDAVGLAFHAIHR